MTVTEHAIRRYKQRIGKKTTARRKIIAQINRDLQKDVWYRKKSNKEAYFGAYILVTSRYQAVCIKGRIVTIEEHTPATKARVEELKAIRDRKREFHRENRQDGKEVVAVAM